MICSGFAVLDAGPNNIARFIHRTDLMVKPDDLDITVRMDQDELQISLPLTSRKNESLLARQIIYNPDRPISALVSGIKSHDREVQHLANRFRQDGQALARRASVNLLTDAV
jgi:hypothetical protein